MKDFLKEHGGGVMVLLIIVTMAIITAISEHAQLSHTAELKRIELRRLEIEKGIAK